MKKYDVVIIGGGTAGIFAAYELHKKAPGLKVALIEQGNPLKKRICPIIAGKVDRCINCRHCSIMNGFGGAGAFFFCLSLNSGPTNVISRYTFSSKERMYSDLLLRIYF